MPSRSSTLLVAALLPLGVLGVQDKDVKYGWMPAKFSKASASYDSATILSWMENVPGSTLLSDMSLPGTSNSWAYGKDLAGSVRAQNFDVLQQICSGIRYLEAQLYQKDGVLWVSDSKMTFQDSPYPLTIPDEEFGSGKFKETDFDQEDASDADGGIIGEIAQHLYYHEQETLLLRLCRDPRDRSPLGDFIKAFNMHIQKRLRFEKFRDAGRGVILFHNYQEDSWPTLEDVRSKVVILVDFGPDANVEDGIPWMSQQLHHDRSLAVRTLSDMENKWLYVNRHIDAAANSKNGKLYITQVAGGGGVIPEIVAVGGGKALRNDDSPRHKMNGKFSGANRMQKITKDNKAVEGMNVRLLEKLKQEKKARSMHTGVIVMNFPGRELITKIISMNLSF